MILDIHCVELLQTLNNDHLNTLPDADLTGGYDDVETKSGATVAVDGTVVLIIDINKIIKHVKNENILYSNKLISSHPPSLKLRQSFMVVWENHSLPDFFYLENDELSLIPFLVSTFNLPA
jgi:hypothetical protein